MKDSKTKKQCPSKSVTKKTTNKLVDRLTYNPLKHKQKHRKKLKEQLQAKKMAPSKQEKLPEKLTFASFNVNGLSLETAWSAEQLLNTRGYDVSYKIYKNTKNDPIQQIIGHGTQ